MPNEVLEHNVEFIEGKKKPSAPRICNRHLFRDDYKLI